MLSINNLSKSYDGIKWAVKNLNLELKKGEIFGFLGHNGAGKTTTLNCCTGILSFDEGQIFIDGHDIKEDSLAAKQNFAFIPDDPNAFIKLKGAEYLAFIADIYSVSDLELSERLPQLLEIFDLGDVLDQQISSYSHGMRQKLLIIGALLYNPNLWILDEPMTGLDPRSSFNLKKLMREHADQGNTVLFSTHVLEVAEKLCDRIGIIHQGSLVYVGTIEELKTRFSESRSTDLSTDESSLENIFLSMTQKEVEDV